MVLMGFREVTGLIIWCFVLAGKGTGRFGEERRWKKMRRAKSDKC